MNEPETIVINVRSQCSVAPCLMRVDALANTDLLMSILSKNFKNRSTFYKVVVKKVGCLNRHV